MWTCPKCKESIEDQFDSCWKCAGEVQPVVPKKPVSAGFLMVLLVLAQLWLVCELTMAPVNPARISFRREQRAAAFKARSEKRTPETEAAVREELRLASKHVHREWLRNTGALFAAFLCVDAIVIYAWRQQGARKKTLD